MRIACNRCWLANWRSWLGNPTSGGALFDEKRTSYTVAATEILKGQFAQGRHYQSHEIFLAEEFFQYDFALALAVFLHEHAHIRGYDGSRDFTDALTHILESVVRERRTLDQFEADWDKAKKAIAEERQTKADARNDDQLEQLEKCNRDELLSILRGLPRNVLRAALRRRRGKSD